MKRSAYWESYSRIYLDEWQRHSSQVILQNLEKTFVSDAIRSLLTKQRNRCTYVDLGCGPGRIIDFVQHADKKHKKIIGIDNSKEMVRVAKSRFAREPRVSIRLGDVSKIILKERAKIDAVTCIRVLKYVPHRKSIFRSISRILRPGGLFIFSATNRRSVAFLDILLVKHYKDTLKEIEESLSAEGLSIVQAQGFQRLPEFLHILVSWVGLTKQLYALEKILHRLLGETFLVRALYIVARNK